MSYWKLTREERLQALYGLKVGQVLSLADIENVKMLSRMALAAMDSESGCLPLDYLQGQKDGLEWAAQLAEANHPETGDWLYDDPIELAKAIRKGPDMPPAQPAPVEVKGSDELYDVIDGDDNVVLSAVSYNEAQTESDGYNGEDLYIVRHEAQPALVVPDEYVAPVPTPTNLGYEAGWNACRAAMLASATQSPGSETAAVTGKWIPVSERMPENKPGSYEYLVFEKLNNRVNHDYWNCPDAGDDTFTSFWNHYGGYVTHWMPLPVATQEVK